MGYYDRVLEVTHNAQEYFRFFEVSGLAYCSGGSGRQPTATFKALVDWVENGVAPKHYQSALTTWKVY